jgi:hypothetical protein
LVQITRTTPLRLTILQFSQMRLTLLRTFMATSHRRWRLTGFEPVRL